MNGDHNQYQRDQENVSYMYTMQRQRIAEEQNIQRAIQKAVQAEREACAQVCEELVLAYVGNASATANQCAEAIRARGER